MQGGVCIAFGWGAWASDARVGCRVVLCSCVPVMCGCAAAVHLLHRMTHYVYRSVHRSVYFALPARLFVILARSQTCRRVSSPPPPPYLRKGVYGGICVIIPFVFSNPTSSKDATFAGLRHCCGFHKLGLGMSAATRARARLLLNCPGRGKRCPLPTHARTYTHTHMHARTRAHTRTTALLQGLMLLLIFACAGRGVFLGWFEGKKEDEDEDFIYMRNL